MKNKGERYTIILSITTAILFLANLLFGSIHIPIEQAFSILFGGEAERESWRFIILESRLPQAITALLCGAALACAGLLLQTSFNNPLAGPSILGIDSGASLGVAIVIMLGGGVISTQTFTLSNFFSVIIGATLGAMSIMAIILFLSTLIKSNIMLLIAGIMIGYITSSAISLLNFFSTAEGVHSYTIWGLGNFGGVSMEQLPLFSTLILIGIAIAIVLIKPLNAMLLGNRYAENLGVNIKRTRNLLLLATGILTATTTAFCGPVAFIGLAVPHIARLLLGTSNHNQLLPVTLICGSVVTLLCNLICTIPGQSGILPLNAITPIFGAPVIIYVIVNQRRIQYFN